jgi:carbonic anhydrase
VITVDELLTGNARHRRGFRGAGLTAPPRRHLAIVTCIDARIDAIDMFGLEAGDAHVIRNAGGRVADDVIRSLVVSTLGFGVRTIAVVHHTDCGMAKMANRDIQELVERIGASTTEDFLSIRDADDALALDVATVATSPLLPSDLTVHGFRYDLDTGQMLTPIG